MAGQRAALSVSATVGVAAATLLVVGGILAGPSVLECSRDSNGFGACLRDKVADTGLIAPGGERVERPDIVADISSEPGPPPAPTGWMEAKANEYEPAPGVPVDLISSPVSVSVAEAPPPAEASVEVAVMPPVELAKPVQAPAGEIASVTLDGAESGLIAEGAASDEPQPPAEVALAGPQGEVTALSPRPEMSIDGAAVLAQPEGLRAEGAGPAPQEPSAAPVELHVAVGGEPISAPPPIAVEFDPQYPNVLVLPPPAEGDDSSFRALQLD